MQNFATWLEAQLNERGWTAADLTRASQTEDNPRGLDSGLISRWRRQPPFGAVPRNAQTLTRLATALNVPLPDVYRAAGLNPPARGESEVAPARHPRLAAFFAQVEAAYHSLTEQEWQVREDAGRALFSVPPTNARTHQGMRDRTRRHDRSTRSNREEPPDERSLPLPYDSMGHSLAFAVAAS